MSDVPFPILSVARRKDKKVELVNLSTRKAAADP